VERDKINHAFRYGGAELARQTVADFLRVPVDCHIVLDPQGFVRIVDILGGINIYVENDMDYEDPYQDLYIHIKRGYQKLDGKTAMQYVRFRNDDLGDIGRMLRQQRFLKVFLDQLFSYSGLLKLPYLKPVIEEVVSTDLVAPTVFKMFRSFRSYGKEAVRFERLQGEPTTIDDISYLQTDPTEVKAMLDALDIAYIK
jgi:LCP family protein required for cell wall assembly